jgi:SSS family solute:Na+ symporter
MSSLPILLYLSTVLVIGLVFSYKRDKCADDFFYGGKSIGTMTFGSSLVLSNLLRYQIVLFPLVALRSFWIAVAASILVVVLSYRIPLSYSGNAAPAENRGGRGGDWFIVGLMLLLSITLQIAGTMALADIMLRDTLDLDYSTTVLLMIVFAGIYAIVGGFSAVAQTQVFQLVVFVGGLIGLALLGSLPGPGDLARVFSPSSSVTVAGGVLGLPVVSLWIWHYDSLSLQQVRSSRDRVSLNRGLLLAGGIALAIAVILLSAAEGSAGLLSFPAAHILSLVCVAALMASFSSSFTSASELMSTGIFKSLKPASSEQKLILVGRLATAGVIGFSIIMIPLVQSMGVRLLDMFILVQACLFPPVTAIYVARLLFRTTGPTGVVPALVAGELAGSIRLLAPLFTADRNVSPPALSWLLSMDIFLFAFCLFCFSLIVLYGAGALASLRLKSGKRFTQAAIPSSERTYH